MTAEPRRVLAPGRSPATCHTFGGGRWCSTRCAWLIESGERPHCTLLGVSLPKGRERHRACREAELRAAPPQRTHTP